MEKTKETKCDFCGKQKLVVSYMINYEITEIYFICYECERKVREL